MPIKLERQDSEVGDDLIQKGTFFLFVYFQLIRRLGGFLLSLLGQTYKRCHLAWRLPDHQACHISVMSKDMLYSKNGIRDLGK